MTRRPAEVFPPGAFIAEEAEERGWTAEYVAKRLGLDLDEYAKLLTGEMRMDGRLITLAGALFGVNPIFFSNLQTAWKRGAR